MRRKRKTRAEILYPTLSDIFIATSNLPTYKHIHDRLLLVKDTAELVQLLASSPVEKLTPAALLIRNWNRA